MTYHEHDDGLRATTARARIVKVDDAKSQQRVDLSGRKNEKPKKIWRLQDWGSTGVPPKDSDGLMVQMGSRGDRTLYLDGGHEKYRPKNTPEGCKAIFNMHGDIIRVFKDSSDLVHQKKVNIRIGHGYKAGDSGEGGEGEGEEGEIDDESDQDEKTISLVLDEDQIKLTYEGSSVTIDSSGNVTAEAANRFAGGVAGGKWVVAKAGRVDLGVSGPDEMAPNKVMTEAGPALFVYAV